MLLKPDQERVKCLLKDTIALLCKNGLEFREEFSIDAVIGVTLDKENLFYISITDSFSSGKHVQAEKNDSEGEGMTPESHRRKRRKKHSGVKEQFDDDDYGENNESYTDEHRRKASRTAARSSTNVKVEDDHDDIVLVKEEPRDVWKSEQNTVYVDDTTSQEFASSQPGSSSTVDNSFQSLSEMNFVPVEPQDENSLWSDGFDARMLQSGVGGASHTAVTSSGNQQENSMGETSEQWVGHPKYACHICNKYFGSSGNLKRHLRAHYGKHPYQCGRCGRGFTSRGNLRGHIASAHTGEKEFKCDICGIEGNYKNNMKAHKLNVHGIHE